MTTAYPQEDPAGRIVLQRDMAITGSTDVGTIDVSTGTLLDQVPVTVTNATGMTSTSVYINTTVNDFAFLSTSSTMHAGVLPSSLVKSTDKQWIFVAQAETSVVAKYPGSTTTFTMPAALTGITFDANNTSAMWTSLPAPYSGAYIYQFDPVGSGEYLSATKAWIEAHHATSLSLPTDVPGYQSMWTLTSAPYAEFSVWHEDGDVTSYTSVTASSATAFTEKAHRMQVQHAAMR